MDWPADVASLTELQVELAAADPALWIPVPAETAVAGVFVCFGRGGTGPGRNGAPGWAGSAVMHNGRIAARASVAGSAGGPYVPGCLAIREGALLELAVRSLPILPDVVIVNATGRDHPRQGGLAVHLGAVLDLPTVGVTHRPLIANGNWPDTGFGSWSPLRVGEETVACWVRTIAAGRPVVVHTGWRTSLETARQIVGMAPAGHRTPEPLREARRLARTSRHAAGLRERDLSDAGWDHRP